MQYIYDYSNLDTAPGNPTSARVEPRRALSGPTLETGKSSAIGAVPYGEHISVVLAMQAAGSGTKLHTHPNEQFNYILPVAVLDMAPGAVLPTHVHENEQFTLVAEGDAHGYVAGKSHRAAERHVIHVPSQISHGIIAGTRGARIVTVQDTRYGFAG